MIDLPNSPDHRKSIIHKHPIDSSVINSRSITEQFFSVNASDFGRLISSNSLSLFEFCSLVDVGKNSSVMGSCPSLTLKMYAKLQGEEYEKSHSESNMLNSFQIVTFEIY